MRNLHNIERSAFHVRQYVGYSHGRVYRIRQQRNGSYSYWQATKQNEVPGETIADNYSLTATTLDILSGKLAALPVPAFSAA